MGRLWIVAAGRIRHPGIRQATEEYLARAARMGMAARVVEVRQGSALGGGTAAMREEARRMLTLSLPSRVVRVALEVNGRTFTSEGFAGWLEARLSEADVAFFVGGAWGLDPEIVRLCDERLSLSPLTLAHELARLILAEQIYRAATLVRGAPYHK
ncbi:MAG: 23S rRNA (pseudouridine(1915)-N(3))-methyltransferase RlmH [Bacillota bacterium]